MEALVNKGRSRSRMKTRVLGRLGGWRGRCLRARGGGLDEVRELECGAKKSRLVVLFKRGGATIDQSEDRREPRLVRENPRGHGGDIFPVLIPGRARSGCGPGLGAWCDELVLRGHEQVFLADNTGCCAGSILILCRNRIGRRGLKT